MVSCKVCNNESHEIFKLKVLDKYDVTYLKCDNCEFIQTEEPYWLDEAYIEAVSSNDVWAVSRPIKNRDIVARLIMKMIKNTNSHKFLDYGGGSGIFVRLMRDEGFDFYSYDTYSKNIYSRIFDVTNVMTSNIDKFSLITCFEVFEHFNNPIEELETIFSKSDSIFFSTLLIPDNLKQIKDWDYLAPYHGQHIAFYSIKTIEFLSKKFNCTYLTDGNSFHLLTKNRVSLDETKFKAAITGVSDNVKHRFFSRLARMLNYFSNVDSLHKPKSLQEQDSMTSIKNKKIEF